MPDKDENSVTQRALVGPSEPLERGSEKHGSTLLSSAGRARFGLTDDPRNCGKATVAWRGSQSDIEICVDLNGNQSLVPPRVAGIEDGVGVVKALLNRDYNVASRAYEDARRNQNAADILGSSEHRSHVGAPGPRYRGHASTILPSC